MKGNDDPLKALATNVTQVVRTELEWSNKKAGEKAGMAPGSVGYFANGRRNETLSNLAALAKATGTYMWQFFVTGMPSDPKRREELALLVRAFSLLSDEGKAQLIGQAKFYCKAEGKADQLEANTRRAPPGPESRVS